MPNHFQKLGKALRMRQSTKPETTPNGGLWVLNVRETMGPVPKPYGREDLYEWDLTLIEPRKDRTCRIDAIWFLVKTGTTVDARATIERFSHEQELSNDQLIELIETHRLPAAPIHLIRTIDKARHYNTFPVATDPKFLRALEWGGLGTATPGREPPTTKQNDA